MNRYGMTASGAKRPFIRAQPERLRRRLEADKGGFHARPWKQPQGRLFHGRSPSVLRPGSTAEVSGICRLASEYGIALVPQGGNTDLGGQTPHHGEVVTELRRVPGASRPGQGIEMFRDTLTGRNATILVASVNHGKSCLQRNTLRVISRFPRTT